MGPEPVGAAILAGGRGRRLGGGKATLELCGRPLVEHVAAACRAAGLDAVIVAKAGTRLPPGLPRLDEPDEPVHPLTGIAAAVEGAAGAAVVVVACDLPFVTPALLRALARHPHAGAVVAESAGRPQPLVARYPARAAAELFAAAHRGDRATDALARLRPVTIRAAPGELDDVDTPEDLVAAEERLRGATTSQCAENPCL